jgi:hypothetical protein
MVLPRFNEHPFSKVRICCKIVTSRIGVK